MSQTNETTLTVKPNEEVTKIMADGNEDRDIMVELAKGNPGALNILLELRKKLTNDLDWKVLTSCLKIKELTGSQLYVFVKDEGGVDKAIESFKEAGWI